jgi:hypothetical protein
MMCSVIECQSRVQSRSDGGHDGAERWVRTIRRATASTGSRSPADASSTLRVYVDHYNSHRPHRVLALTPPTPERRPTPCQPALTGSRHRRDRLGGLIHEIRRSSVTDEFVHPTGFWHPTRLDEVPGWCFPGREVSGNADASAARAGFAVRRSGVPPRRVGGFARGLRAGFV